MENRAVKLLFFIIVAIVSYQYSEGSQKSDTASPSAENNAVSDKLCREKVENSLGERFKNHCVKYTCKEQRGKTIFLVDNCLKPVAPKDALECVSSRKERPNWNRFPLCCERLKCIVQVGSIKYLRTIGQPEEHIPDVDLDIDYQDDELPLSANSTHAKRDNSKFEYDDYIDDNVTESKSSDPRLGQVYVRDPVVIAPKTRIEMTEHHSFIAWLVYPLKNFFLSRYRILTIKIKVKTNVSLGHDFTSWRHHTKHPVSYDYWIDVIPPWVQSTG